MGAAATNSLHRRSMPGIANGRRKMLVEMATGTGKTRTAAALLKRLFEANWATRALFVVDRNTLAIQTEDAFAKHLPHLSASRS